MCLITRQKKAKILKKDLIVYKKVILNNLHEYTSFYKYYFKWKKNILNPIVELIPILRQHHTDNSDGHWMYADYRAHTKYEGMSQCMYINEGYHAYITKERGFDVNDDTIIMSFLIPKGSEVFYDTTGLVVSNQMMML